MPVTFFTRKRYITLALSLTYKKSYVGHLTLKFTFLKFKMTFNHQKIIFLKFYSWNLLFYLGNVLASPK